MADFYTTTNEERLIDSIKRELKVESDMPKYLILQIALKKAFCLEKLPLNSPKWNSKNGERGKEYNLEQITQKGKERDFDRVLRGIFYMLHKNELEGEDLFKNDKKYLEILGKYLHRGLLEIENSWKSTDCFYQWILDNLGLVLNKNLNSKTHLFSEISSEKSPFESIKDALEKEKIFIEKIQQKDSYRHEVFDIRLSDSTKVSAFLNASKFFDNYSGCENVLTFAKSGISNAFSIQFPKPKQMWHKLGRNEFESGFLNANLSGELPILAGFDIDKNPFYFDLENAIHTFIAGATGSGKTRFLQVIILCLLHSKRAEICVIDPKTGIDYAIFGDKIKLIGDMSEAERKVDLFIEEMEDRLSQLKQDGATHIRELNLPYEILIVDELNDLVAGNKGIKDKLARLGNKSRQAGIFMILGTQRPDGVVFKGLKTNIVSKIAMRVSNERESALLLDASGAEKLSGKGDMLVKLDGMNEPKRCFSMCLEKEEIENILNTIL